VRDGRAKSTGGHREQAQLRRRAWAGSNCNADRQTLVPAGPSGRGVARALPAQGMFEPLVEASRRLREAVSERGAELASARAQLAGERKASSSKRSKWPQAESSRSNEVPREQSESETRGTASPRGERGG
jgi:hypothetical protein